VAWRGVAWRGVAWRGVAWLAVWLSFVYAHMYMCTTLKALKTEPQNYNVARYKNILFNFTHIN
jgi:hypothetical protein